MGTETVAIPLSSAFSLRRWNTFVTHLVTPSSGRSPPPPTFDTRPSRPTTNRMVTYPCSFSSQLLCQSRAPPKLTPSPSWPPKLAPQQRTVPSARTAQL